MKTTYKKLKAHIKELGLKHTVALERTHGRIFIKKKDIFQYDGTIIVPVGNTTLRGCGWGHIICNNDQDIHNKKWIVGFKLYNKNKLQLFKNILMSVMYFKADSLYYNDRTDCWNINWNN